MISAIYIVPTIFFKYLNNFSWMDGMARLVDGCPQVPRAACYQDNVLIIVMLQMSAATALSPPDLLEVLLAYECNE